MITEVGIQDNELPAYYIHKGYFGQSSCSLYRYSHSFTRFCKYYLSGLVLNIAQVKRLAVFKIAVQYRLFKVDSISLQDTHPYSDRPTSYQNRTSLTTCICKVLVQN